MSGVKVTQCLLFFAHERGQDIAAATSSSSIQFYALLPEVFRTEYPEFLKIFTENGIVVMSASDGSSQQFAQGDKLEIIEILLCVTSAAASNTLTLIVVFCNLHAVKRIFSSSSTIAINTYLMYDCQQFEVYPAMDDNNAVIMNRILTRGPNICYEYLLGESLLNLAARRGHETFAKVILEHGVDVNSKRIDRSTPLHVAVKGGHRNVVDLLLLNGANVGSKKFMGSTALHIAVEEGHLCIVKILLRNGADPESKTDDGSTALSLAVGKSDLDMVKLLLYNGADSNCRDNNGRTLVLSATEKFVLEIAEVLLSYGARLNVQLNRQFGVNQSHPENSTLLQLLLESCFCDSKILTDPAVFSGCNCWLAFHPLGQLHPKTPVFVYARHIVKVIAANLYPLPSLINFAVGDLIDFKAECELEVAQMNDRTVGNTSLTFFDVLTKNTSQVARLLKNSSVAQTLCSADLHTEFPNYGGFLKWQFRKGNQRKLALEEGIESIDSVSHLFRQLPREVKENILDYLSIRDILILKHARAHTSE